jgi:putative membrane protein
MKLHVNIILLIVMTPILGLSAWEPYDRLTWWLEVCPVFAGFIALFILQMNKWRISNFSMLLIGMHMILLAVGGHYTYARVPIGDWAKDVFDLSRNHYDRLGHIFQGLTPAILCRELFIRKRVVAVRGWTSVLIVSLCMAVSSIYELLEWVAALISEEAAQSFLGTQGDHWDTQSDMLCALIGAMGAVVLLRFAHNRSMRKISLEK